MKARGKWLLIGFIIVLGAASVIIWRDWQKSPSASLYYLGKAIYGHDAALFLQYVDITSIMEQARSYWPYHSSLPGDQSDGKALEMISRFVARPDRPNLPGSMSILLNAVMSRPANGQVEVALSDFWLHSEARIGFTMRQYPDAVWRVARLNKQDLEKLLFYCLGLEKR
jgi:hypothetical protein